MTVRVAVPAVVRTGVVAAMTLLTGSAGAVAAQDCPTTSAREAPDTSGLRPLSLADAEALALDGNRGLRADRARADAAEARARGAAAFRWPSVGVEAGFNRSDDPVAAFGTRLRQARFREADFALDALNRPDAVDDWVGAVGVRWSALDPSRWAGMEAARLGARAARLGVERGADGVLLRTRLLYLDAVRAEAVLAAARVAEEAAASTAALTARRRDQGLLTDADLLQAEAALAGARAATVAAERGVGDARGRLALHLGLPEGTVPLPTDTAVVPGPPDTGRGAVDLAGRTDLRASSAGLEAAAAQVRSARAARLPTLDAFARLSSHAPDPLDGREAHVTLGLAVTVPLFTGGAVGSAVGEAAALERAARLEHEERLAAARTELEEAGRAVDAARRGAEAASAARLAAEEAARLLRRRFEEGLATTAELLQAEARATEARTADVEAGVGVQQALALLAFARGDSGPAGADDPARDDDTHSDPS